MKKSSAPFALTVLASSVLLSACANTLSDSTAAINTVNYPLVIRYDGETQDKAADELESGHCPVMAQMIIDYGQMRDETRVLLGKKVDVGR